MYLVIYQNEDLLEAKTLEAAKEEAYQHFAELAYDRADFGEYDEEFECKIQEYSEDGDLINEQEWTCDVEGVKYRSEADAYGVSQGWYL